VVTRATAAGALPAAPLLVSVSTGIGVLLPMFTKSAQK
jgi:hypothetical protein